MALSSKLFAQSGEDLQTALESIDDLQDQVVIYDNDKVSYDRAIYRLDENLLDQCNVVNVAFNNVETAYNDRIAGICRTDLFWRITNITQSSGDDDDEYSLICTKMTAGGYTELSNFWYPPDDGDGGGTEYFGNTLIVLRPDGTRQIFPINNQNERSIGFGYTFGFEPRNYYGVKYYNEPYSDDIGDTLVGGFIGTITAGESTITAMQPVGLGLSELLKVGQIIQPKDLDVFSGTAKITGITTGQTDLRVIVPSYVGIGTSLSWVNIITVDQSALQTIKAPLNDGKYGTFEVLDDPANFANSGREKYSLDKLADPYLPQTVGIMQTANIGMGVSIALDNSGFPSAAMAWDPNMEGYVVEYDSRGNELAGPVEPPKVGSGVCYWKAGFTHFPRASVGSATKAVENATITVDASDIGNMYGSLTQGASCTALDTAVTDAIGISSTKESTLSGSNDTSNPTLVEGVNALRTERNEDYSLPIWGFRVGIGAQNEIVDRLNTLQQHLDDLTIRNVIDS